jgi:hypothetical protein
MSYGDCLGAFRLPLSCADFMNRVKNIGAVVSVAAPIADSDRYVFQDNEPILVFERLPLDKPRPHRAVAEFTAISIHKSDPSDHTIL